MRLHVTHLGHPRPAGPRRRRASRRLWLWRDPYERLDDRRREHFAVATAALVVGLESQVPSIYRRQYPVLLEKYKFDEDAVEFFDLHITSDEIHGERGYQIVLKSADTPALQQRCLQLVRHGAEMRLPASADVGGASVVAVDVGGSADESEGLLS